MKVIRTIQGAKFASIGEPQTTKALVEAIKEDPWRFLQRVEVVDLDVEEKLTAEEKRFVAAGEKGCFPLAPFHAAIVKKEMARRDGHSKILVDLGLPDLEEYEKFLERKRKKSSTDESKNQDNGADGTPAVPGATGAANEPSTPDGEGKTPDQPVANGNPSPGEESDGLNFDSESLGNGKPGDDTGSDAPKNQGTSGNKRGK